MSVLHKIAKQLMTKTASDAMAGLLRSSADSAWRVGGSPPKPKTTAPMTSKTAPARETPMAKPPSNGAYLRDATKSISDPARGSRLAVPK